LLSAESRAPVARVLARRPGSLTVLELSQGYCERLRRELDADVEIVQADATAMPFEDGRFSAVPARLERAGLLDPEVERGGGSFRFRARRARVRA
jgi:Methyltransferase domain